MYHLRFQIRRGVLPNLDIQVPLRTQARHLLENHHLIPMQARAPAQNWHNTPHVVINLSQTRMEAYAVNVLATHHQVNLRSTPSPNQTPLTKRRRYQKMPTCFPMPYLVSVEYVETFHAWSQA